MNRFPTPIPSMKRGSDRGAAMVEFAFVGVIVILLLLGVVIMGFLLSFKQNITQAAAEGARAVVGIADDPTTPGVDERDTLVDSTLDTVVAEYTDSGCGSSGMSCQWKIHSCTADTSDFAALPDDRPGNNECITVRVEFANSGSSRIFPQIPLISNIEPDTIASQSTARLVT